MNYQTDYAIKCDECRVEIGRTSSVGRSAAGGRCDTHRIERTYRTTACVSCGSAVSTTVLLGVVECGHCAALVA